MSKRTQYLLGIYCFIFGWALGKFAPNFMLLIVVISWLLWSFVLTTGGKSDIHRA